MGQSCAEASIALTAEYVSCNLTSVRFICVLYHPENKPLSNPSPLPPN